MKPHYLDMPLGDAAALSEWLELRLARSEVGEVVAELRALSQVELTQPTAVDSRPRSLTEVLGANREALLDRGLAALTGEQVREMIATPDLLLELHDELLRRGGPYWQNRFEQVYAEWQKGLAPSMRTVEKPVDTSTPRLSRDDRKRTWGTAAFAGWMVAAAMLVAIGLQYASPPATRDTTWGWQRREVLAEQSDRTMFFEQLVSAAREWHDERPTTEVALAKRMLEFRAGCTALQLSPLSSLSAADRDWLRQQCRRWSDQIEEQLASLESGEHPRQVHDAMNKLVDEATTSLRERTRVRA